MSITLLYKFLLLQLKILHKCANLCTNELGLGNFRYFFLGKRFKMSIFAPDLIKKQKYHNYIIKYEFENCCTC